MGTDGCRVKASMESAVVGYRSPGWSCLTCCGGTAYVGSIVEGCGGLDGSNAMCGEFSWMCCLLADSLRSLEACLLGCVGYLLLTSFE